MDTLYTDDGCRYDGMAQAVVTGLRNDLGLTTSFVDETTYLSYIVAHQPTLS